MNNMTTTLHNQSFTNLGCEATLQTAIVCHSSRLYLWMYDNTDVFIKLKAYIL